MNQEKIYDRILKITNSNSIESIELVQKLWSDYGRLERLKLNAGENSSLILKLIDLKNRLNHPRGWNTNRSHQRKLDSYRVEINFYKNYKFLADSNSYFPELIYSSFDDDLIILVLEDLKEAGYPKALQSAGENEIKLCLKWLANFHAKGFNASNKGIWQKGTYWHLGTRQDEFNKMSNSHLKKYANKIDQVLDSAKFKTIIHGDAKLANFCFSNNSDKVAAVDFQYVGFGTPAKDLVYFLGSVLDDEGLENYFDNYKANYYIELEKSISKNELELNFLDIRNDIERMWELAVADFERFLLGWMPNHRKLTSFSKKITDQVLERISN